MKILISDNPLAASNAAMIKNRAVLANRPAWISPQRLVEPPEVTAYRLCFDLPERASLRIHVSADERYLFYVDGQLEGRGPERGSDRAWFYETYDLDLSCGAHVLTAIVWRLGDLGPLAQIGIKGGFLLEADAPYGDLLSTRSAAWECMQVAGVHFAKPDVPGEFSGAWYVQPTQTTDGRRYPWGIEHGQGEGWKPVRRRCEDSGFLTGSRGEHLLQQAVLPAQLKSKRSAGMVRHVSEGNWDDVQAIKINPDAHIPTEEKFWQDLLDRKAHITILPHTRRQVVFDLEDYVCAYPQIQLSGGAGSRVTIGWAEALHLDRNGIEKGKRDEVDGRIFFALCRDVVIADGGAQRRFAPLWWRAGRFIELLVESGEQPLVIESFELEETRYPLEMESRFSSSDKRLEAVTPVALRALQMCAHETYMDCPYYEQMMYVGDTRLEALVTYILSSDDRLPRKAVELFGLSRQPDGLTQARYPGRDIQTIPPFSLWWVGMVYDYALWRGDRAFIASQLPGVRAVLDGFLRHVQPDHLLQAPDGWNFSDWVKEWPLGVPPEGFAGVSGLLNWHLVYTLGLAAHLEEWAGEDLLAQRWKAHGDAIAQAANRTFWDETRGLFADNLAHTSFSEHTQCLALLSGVLPGEQLAQTGQSLLNNPELTRTTIYFTHYLFEAYHLLRQPKAFFERMKLWFALPGQGFKTTPESPEPARSDCHAWGAHPLYHYFATLLGIRPAAFGFEHVEISPIPGHLTRIAGKLVHPNGEIETALEFKDQQVRGWITLPANVSGKFYYADKMLQLKPGRQEIRLV